MNATAMKATTKTALVLGVTGSVGREIATALLGRGWRVLALHRNPASVTRPLDGVQWIKGDVMQRADVIESARGVDLIVHAVNPPKYHNWRGLALPMLENTIKAAHAHGARIVLPAPIYNFGPGVGPLLKESSAQCPPTRKGAVRVEMEILLQQASLYGVRSIVVRSGDYFGPGAGNSWLTQGMVRAPRRLRTVYYPGPFDIGHSWAYLPDLAEAVLRILERPSPLDNFEVFHFRGHWFERGAEIAATICRLAGLDARRIKPFPWWLVKLAAPFVEVCREMQEMRYLWEVPLSLDNVKLQARIGEEPRTPIDAALRETLKDVLPAAPARLPGTLWSAPRVGAS
jgi:nucleoside-diphosphate-sugar epimerase